MANNPYVNKVVYGDTTLIDISDTTATADKIHQGFTAYGADGRKITGTAPPVHNQSKTVTPTDDQQVVTVDSGYTGLSQVTVEAIPKSYGHIAWDGSTLNVF